MKIAYITREPASDVKVWSGTKKYIYDKLCKSYDVTNIVVSQSLVHKIFNKIVRKLSFNKINYSILDFWFTNIEIKKQIKELNNYDILFFVAQSDLLGMPKLKFNKKIIYLTDATYSAMINYYYYNVPKMEQRLRNSLERESLMKATQVIFTSEWAKDSAIKFYGIDKKKLNVVPFGANLPDKYVEKKKISRNIELLIVGVDWKRKGIDIAIEATKILNTSQTDYHFTLNIVGFKKTKNKYYPDYIKFFGRLNKKKIDDLNKLIALYLESDFFIFPTQAECSAIVLCEASMYGLPVITYKTGGLETYVDDEQSGYLLPEGSNAEMFASKILYVLKNKIFFDMSNKSRKLYKKKLNWNNWEQDVDRIISN